MYPPHVSAAEVRAVIRELKVGTTLPSGAAVRLTLKARFGSRGGVTRIYRLLAEERTRMVPPAPLGDVEVLMRELQLMRQRAERAEQREEAHQDRWALEIDRLRLQVASLQPLAQQARIAQETHDRLRQQLRSAELRVAALELQLDRREGNPSSA